MAASGGDAFDSLHGDLRGTLPGSWCLLQDSFLGVLRRRAVDNAGNPDRHHFDEQEFPPGVQAMFHILTQQAPEPADALHKLGMPTLFAPIFAIHLFVEMTGCTDRKLLRTLTTNFAHFAAGMPPADQAALRRMLAKCVVDDETYVLHMDVPYLDWMRFDDTSAKVWHDTLMLPWPGHLFPVDDDDLGLGESQNIGLIFRHTDMASFNAMYRHTTRGLRHTLHVVRTHPEWGVFANYLRGDDACFIKMGQFGGYDVETRMDLLRFMFARQDTSGIAPSPWLTATMTQLDMTDLTWEGAPLAWCLLDPRIHAERETSIPRLVQAFANAHPEKFREALDSTQHVFKTSLAGFLSPRAIKHSTTQMTFLMAAARGAPRLGIVRWLLKAFTPQALRLDYRCPDTNLTACMCMSLWCPTELTAIIQERRFTPAQLASTAQLTANATAVSRRLRRGMTAAMVAPTSRHNKRRTAGNALLMTMVREWTAEQCASTAVRTADRYPVILVAAENMCTGATTEMLTRWSPQQCAAAQPCGADSISVGLYLARINRNDLVQRHQGLNRMQALMESSNLRQLNTQVLKRWPLADMGMTPGSPTYVASMAALFNASPRVIMAFLTKAVLTFHNDNPEVVLTMESVMASPMVKQIYDEYLTTDDKATIMVVALHAANSMDLPCPPHEQGEHIPWDSIDGIVDRM